MEAPTLSTARRVFIWALALAAFGLGGWGFWFAWQMSLAGSLAIYLAGVPLLAWLVASALLMAAARLAGRWRPEGVVGAGMGALLVACLLGGLAFYVGGPRIRGACIESCYDTTVAAGQASTCPSPNRERTCRAIFSTASGSEVFASPTVCAEYQPAACH